MHVPLRTYHDGFENFVGDGGKYPLVVILAQVDVQLGQVGNLGPEQDTQGDVHILQI